MAIRSRPSSEVLAADVTSLPAAGSLFWRYGSPRVIAAGLATAVATRVVLSWVVGWSRWDAAAVLTVVALVPFVEWFIHLVVLHATPRRIAGLKVDPGAGHREHHLQPTSVDRVLLWTIDAAVFQMANAALVVAVIGLPLWLLGVDRGTIFGAVSTGIIVAIAALGHYEWSHFLFHLAYRPKSRYYRRLKSNHRLHHWRNERYWLGVTSNAADRLLGTYPRSRSDVPLSPTARTLGVDPEPTGPTGQ